MQTPGALGLWACVSMGDHASPLASLRPRGKDGALSPGWAGLTLRTTPEVTAMFSASSTVLVATVLTLLTTASLTALACSLVFSATVGGLWLALALTPPLPGHSSLWFSTQEPRLRLPGPGGSDDGEANPGCGLAGEVWVCAQLGTPVGNKEDPELGPLVPGCRSPWRSQALHPLVLGLLT